MVRSRILTVIAVLGCAGQSAALPPDMIPPVVTCPANITDPSSVPTVITYVASCSDAGGVQSFACVPPPGGTFAVGLTPVTCTCVDIANNTSACTFTVRIGTPSTPTATATATATTTTTPTATPVAQGGACTDAAQCATGLFCSDDVCCDTACVGAGTSCDVPGQVGTCVTAPAAAPAASPLALLVMLAALILTAFVALHTRWRE